MNPKYKKIFRSDFNYSQIGEASAKQFSYILDKRNHLRELLKEKKLHKLVTENFIDQEEKDVYDDLYEKDGYEEDIFDKDYKNKYEQLLEEQKQKYLDLKNSCSYKIDNKKEKISKKYLLDKYDNDKYKYHLIHHHHDHYIDKALLKANEGQLACTSYNPKMEYIYKKIIYCPQFKKMSGRYDQENLRDKIEHQIEINLQHKKETESKLYKKKKEQMKALIKKEKLAKIHNKEKLELSKRHLSVIQKRNSNILNTEKLFDNSEELINESRNFNKKLFKRTNSMINTLPQFMSFGLKNNNKSNKNSFEDIKNIEEEKDENEDYNYEYKEKIKNDITNNFLDGNTLSSANYNKTTSGKRKDSSIYYNNNETDIIYPYNISKNDSNILINNNYLYKKEKKEQKDKIYYLRNEDNNLKDLNSSKKRVIAKNKNYKNTSNISSKQNLFPSLNNKKVVNFDKMLSREYIRKLNEQKFNIYSSLSPNYESIRPNCIMKVKYAKKNFRKNKTKEFKSVFNEFVFDINKIYNNYNNHFPPKDIYIDKLTGRKLDNNSPLPSYLLNQYNRNAFNSFNDKSLEMNNFSNGNLRTLKSSFNEKKTFNYKLYDQYYNNDNNNELSSIMIKIRKNILNKKNKDNESKNECKSLSCSNIIKEYKNKNYDNEYLLKGKIPEYYKLNLDKLDKFPSNLDKIDGFTLKTIKTNKSAIDLLTNYEKKIFLSKLNNNE